MAKKSLLAEVVDAVTSVAGAALGAAAAAGTGVVVEQTAAALNKGARSWALTRPRFRRPRGHGHEAHHASQSQASSGDAKNKVCQPQGCRQESAPSQSQGYKEQGKDAQNALNGYDAAKKTKLFADGGYAGAKLEAALADQPVELEIVKRTDNEGGFKVIRRRWVVERTLSCDAIDA